MNEKENLIFDYFHTKLSRESFSVHNTNINFTNRQSINVKKILRQQAKFENFSSQNRSSTDNMLSSKSKTKKDVSINLLINNKSMNQIEEIEEDFNNERENSFITEVDSTLFSGDFDDEEEEKRNYAIENSSSPKVFIKNIESSDYSQKKYREKRRTFTDTSAYSSVLPKVGKKLSLFNSSKFIVSDNTRKSSIDTEVKPKSVTICEEKNEISNDGLFLMKKKKLENQF